MVSSFRCSSSKFFQPFNDKAAKDKERYEEEMAEYKVNNLIVPFLSQRVEADFRANLEKQP